MTTDLHPLPSYPGGKAGPGSYQAIINQIPPTSLYAELFLGGGAVLRNLRPAAVALGVDADAAAVAQWAGHGIPGLRVIQGDALTVLRSYPWPAEAVIYLDPPYPRWVRSSQQRLYRCELWTEEQHRDLLAAALEVPCRVIISSYYSELYAEFLAAWRTATFQAVDRAGNVRTEWLWMNYPEPLELHDSRYLGADYRARELIRVKVRRFREKLLTMPLEHRTAIFAMVDQLRNGGWDPTGGNTGIVEACPGQSTGEVLTGGTTVAAGGTSRTTDAFRSAPARAPVTAATGGSTEGTR